MNQLSFSLTLLLLFIVIATDVSANYCSPSLCPYSGPNVGCNPPPPSGGSSCHGKSAIVVPMTSGFKATILHLHNYYRSQVASGNRAPLPSATGMYTLEWDDELAAQASNNARSCVFAHDRCRNTPQFRSSGQNLAIIKYHGLTYTVTGLIKSFLAGWWKEWKNTTPAYIQAFPHSQLYNIGHFTVLVNDRVRKVGCALQKWNEGRSIFVYFVCNYSYTNVINKKVYNVGRTGSDCKKGMNPNYFGLCMA